VENDTIDNGAFASPSEEHRVLNAAV